MAERGSRRRFLGRTIQGAGGLLILKEARSAFSYQANEKLNVALVGCGGRGSWFVDTIPHMENLVALCDVNDQRAAEAYKKLPDLPREPDYRKLLEKRGKTIDAVIIAAPDHIHAPCTLLAMRLGKHVFCEKPLTQNIHEARVVRQTAARSPVATQMGNQGTASEAFRRAFELLQAGVIGEVREVHAWNESGGPGWTKRPEGEQPVPDTLKWDLWQGPVPPRPYHSEWMNWHGWRAFGTGQLGNWASHTMNLPFKALQLDALWNEPSSPGAAANKVRVRAESESVNRFSFPRWEIITYEFPQRDTLPPVTLRWYNGHNIPASQRQKLEDLLGRKLDWGDAGEKKWNDYAGCILVGSKGLIHATGHNMSFSLLPEARFRDFDGPPKTLPRTPGHEVEWFQACRGGPKAMSNFEYAGRLAEFVLLGNIATQFSEALEFDPVACSFGSHAEANQALRRDVYRPGWEI